jgi:hypothetical protein
LIYIIIIEGWIDAKNNLYYIAVYYLSLNVPHPTVVKDHTPWVYMQVLEVWEKLLAEEELWFLIIHQPHEKLWNFGFHTSTHMQGCVT